MTPFMRRVSLRKTNGSQGRELPETVVHVVDDDASMRSALVRLLRAAGYEARAYSSAGDFLMAARPDTPGCILLDVRMPGPNGLDLHEALAREQNPLPVIFITGHGDIPMSVQAMKAGAVEFLTKPFAHEVLLSAIRQAIERSHSSLDQEQELQLLRGRYAALSRREQDVMALVVVGRLNKQVGFELGISEITVKAHRGRVMRKMEAGSLADLINMAAKLRLAAAPQR